MIRNKNNIFNDNNITPFDFEVMSKAKIVILGFWRFNAFFFLVLDKNKQINGKTISLYREVDKGNLERDTDRTEELIFSWVTEIIENQINIWVGYNNFGYDNHMLKILLSKDSIINKINNICNKNDYIMNRETVNQREWLNSVNNLDLMSMLNKSIRVSLNDVAMTLGIIMNNFKYRKNILLVILIYICGKMNLKWKPIKRHFMFFFQFCWKIRPKSAWSR